MTVKQELLEQIRKLINTGDTFVDESISDMGFWESREPESKLRAFETAARAIVNRIAGDSSEYYKSLPPLDHLNQLKGRPETIGAISGILTSLHGAIEEDLLETIESRIRANVHVDFMKQSRELLDSRHHVAAMVLIGGVLEDHLLKLCIKHGLTWTGVGGITKYNDACKDDVYIQTVWREAQVVGDARNNAAHGNGGQVTSAQVERSYDFVGGVLADYPT